MNDTAPPRPVLLPLTAMARSLGVSPRWLRGEAEAGRLPGLRADRTWIFDADMVERLLAERARLLPTGEGVRHG
jgi:hypothetical protein